jgi:predicted RND superfamily exporter protein
VAWRPDWVVLRAPLVLVLLGGVTATALVALVSLNPPGLNLSIDPSTEPLLPSGDPSREAYLRAVADFGDDEVYVIALETEDVFRVEPLSVMRAVNDRLARFPEVRRVQSLTDVVAFRYDAGGDWIEVTSFIDEIPSDPAGLAELRRRALSDPLYRRTLVSEDGRTAAINVTFREMTDQEFIAARLDQRVLRVLEEAAAPGIRFHVAGRPHIKSHVYHVMLRDMRLLIPAALVVVAVGLGLVFGTRRAVVLPMGWTFGAVAYLGRPLTVLTTLLAPMLTAIGSVYGIHAVARYEEEAASAASASEAALASLRHSRLPVLVAGFTTMIGFAALLITDVPAVLEVGAFSVLGVAAITLLTLVGLHAALALLPLRPLEEPSGVRAPSARIASSLDRLLDGVARGAQRHSLGVLVVWALLLAVCVAAIPRIVIDTDYLSFFPPRSKIRQDFENVNRLLAGAVPLYVSMRSDEPGTFREPGTLVVMERIQEEAARIPQVSRTLSLVDTVRVMNRAMSKGDPSAERIPETRGEVAELLFMAPKGHLDRYTNVNHSSANILVRTGAVGTAAVQSVADQLESVVASAGALESVSVDVTGNAVLLAHSADGIARGQPRTVGLAALAIFVLVTIAFRSIPLGLVAMAPNIVPVLMYFGILGLGAAPLSLPTSLIGSVALGIAVDDTAHFLVRYGNERRRGLTPEQAAAVCGRRVGRPIAITSVMLMAGFLVVALSGFATLRQFGVLSAVTMGICLLTDLIMLPALLMVSSMGQ